MTRRRVIVVAAELLRHEVVGHRHVIDETRSVDDAHVFAFFGDHPLDERLVRVDRVVEHHDVAAPRRAQAVGQLVHDQAVLVGKRGRHALTFDAGDLEAEGHDERGVDGGRRQRLEPRHQLVFPDVQPVNDDRGAGRRSSRTFAAPAARDRVRVDGSGVLVGERAGARIGFRRTILVRPSQPPAVAFRASGTPAAASSARGSPGSPCPSRPSSEGCNSC